MSEIDPAELSTVPETDDDDSIDLPQPEATGRPRPDREGLPAGYRMRADPHYVETLVSRRADKSAGDGPKAAQRRVEVPDRTELDEARELKDRHQRLLSQLSEDLGTMESVISVLASDTSRVARRANVDVLRAQAWRSAWMIRANALLDGHHRVHIKPRPLGFVLSQIRHGFAAEGRLNGITLEVHASDWEAVVTIDEQSVIAAVSGAIFATFGMLGSAEGATIKVAVIATGRELRSVEVSQDEVSLGPQAVARFFDATWPDRPGGWTCALGAVAARTVTHQHGGDAALIVGDPSGSVIRLGFSRVAVADTKPS